MVHIVFVGEANSVIQVKDPGALTTSLLTREKKGVGILGRPFETRVVLVAVGVHVERLIVSECQLVDLVT